jgi:hypothetical protein
MIPKKGVVILVAIALVLAVVAVSMNFDGSDEIKTKSSEITQDEGNGQVGVTVLSPTVEDRLEGDNS